MLLVLGANYVGFMDDLAVFDRALAGKEVEVVYQLRNGIRDLYPPGQTRKPSAPSNGSIRLSQQFAVDVTDADGSPDGLQPAFRPVSDSNKSGPNTFSPYSSSSEALRPPRPVGSASKRRT